MTPAPTRTGTCSARTEVSTMTILDADGHVTETQDQIVKYLDEPYRRRPSGAFFYPWDGWDRRLLGTLGAWAGGAAAWLRALAKGGGDHTAVYTTLGRV